MNYPWASRLMVMLSIAVAGRALATPRKPSVAVQSVPIAAHTLADTLTAYGRISVDPQATTALVAQAPAYVDTLQTSPGAEVHKGQPLLSLRTTPAAQAQYRVAQSQLRFAEQALKRQRQLLTQQLATHADIEAAQNTLAGAQAAFDTQKALGNGQALRTISAPFAGIVSALSVSLGQQLGAGTTLLELARGDSLQAVLAIPASQRQQVHVNKSTSGPLCCLDLYLIWQAPTRSRSRFTPRSTPRSTP